ncbi:MAG: oligosaccharide flippase family protein [Bacteroidota bacterium]
MPFSLPALLHRISPSNLSSLQLFQLIRYGTFLLIGIAFAKLELPLSQIGNFETFLLISGMVSFFWVSGIINTLLSIYPKKSEQEKKEVLFSTFISLLVFSLVAGGLLFIFSENLLSFLDKTENGINRLVFIYLILNCPSFLIEYILFLKEKKKELVYYAILSSLLTLAAVLLPVLFNYGISYSFAGLTALAGVKFIILLFLISRYGSFTFNAGMTTTTLRIAAPLLLSIFVSGSAEYIDGMLVKAKFDDVSFAVYRYGAKELPLLLIIANTFSMAMIPSIASNLSQGMAELKRKSTQLMHVFFPLTIVLMLCSGYIYKYAFSESFIYSALIFNIYLLLSIPRLVFPQTVLTGMQRTKFLLLSSLLEITLNVSLSIWLAGKIGLSGIALGTLIAFCFDKIFLVSVNYFVYKIKPSAYLNGGVFCIYSIATCIAFPLSYFILKDLG